MSAGTGTPAGVQKRRREVDVQRHRVDCGCPRLIAAGHRIEKRHPQRFLVHEPLVEQPVIAEKEPLIAGVDDDGVLRETLRHRGNRAAGRRCRRPIGPSPGSPACSADISSAPAPRRSASTVSPSRVDRDGVGLRRQPRGERGARQVRGRLELEIASRQIGGDPLLVLVERVGPGRVAVPQRLRLGNPPVGELRAVRSDPAPTAGAAPCDAASGRTACSAAVADEVDREIGDDVRDVAAGVGLFSGRGVEHRIRCTRPARAGSPSDRSQPDRCRDAICRSCRCDSRRLQQPRHRQPRAVEPVEHRHAVEVRVLSRENRRAARRADRIGREDVVAATCPRAPADRCSASG